MRPLHLLCYDPQRQLPRLHGTRVSAAIHIMMLCMLPAPAPSAGKRRG